MIRNVDLVSYLPPIMAEFQEYRATLEAENPEFVLVWNATDQVLQNEFIATADEYGISRFEQILNILPSKEDTLESRRSRVQTRWFNTIPYTLKALLGMSTLITFKAGDKTPITKNFTRNEFQCSCGCSAQMVDEMLVQKLQTIRTVYDTPLKITSGYRCVKHNAAVGGAKSSKHLYGIAADVKDPTGKLNPVALAILASSTFGGVGVYWYGTAAFVHVDVRKTKATWLCTQKGVYNYTSHHTFIMPTVRRGSSTQTEKSAIKMLQRLLGLPVDGIFGKNTENAVRAAQKAHNLAVDGIVGKNTWCAIAGVE